MKLYSDTQFLPFKYSTENRPWGYYGLYSDNENCTTKILYINKNESLSMQYHFCRSQFYLILDNDFIIDYSSEPVSDSIINETDEEKRFQELEEFLKNNLITTTASEMDMFGFRERVVHRAKYIGDRDYGRILDVAFGNNIESDIVRIKDSYGRI